MIFKILLGLLIAAIPLQSLKRLLYILFLRYKIGRNVKIGLSLVLCKEAHIDDDCIIGNFNVIIGVNKLVLKNGAVIKKFNWIRDVNEFIMDSFSCIVKKNHFSRSAHLTKHGNLYLGKHSVITTGHLFDLIDDINIDSKTTIAGMGSQFWTHGFDNFNNRIQGPITIGESCYIGARCMINLGVAIASYTQIGMGSIIPKSINESGFFWAGIPALKINPIKCISERADVTLSMTYEGYNFYRKK